jgi:peptidyl-tRNA hydrolase
MSQGQEEGCGGAPPAAAPEDAIVQYLLIRSDLDKGRYNRGALIAQGAHASVAAIESSRELESTRAYLASIDSMHKIVLAAPSAEDIHRVSSALTAATLQHHVWLEQPERVVTALATAPYKRSILSSFFAGLKLLR